jgi:hypothetical protein
MRLSSFATIVTLISAAPASGVAAQNIRVVPMKEAWYFTAGQSVFHSPRSVAVTSDCQVWVADPIAGVWRVRCTGGVPQPVGAIGRSEGDHEMPWALASMGPDSLVLLDRGLQRVTSYESNGRFVSQRTVTLPEVSMGNVIAVAAADSAYSVWLHQYPNELDPLALQSVVLRLEVNARDTIARFDGLPSIYWGSSFAGSRIAPPMQRRPLVAFMPQGGFVAGMNDSAVVRRYDASGKELRSFGLTLPVPPAVSKGDRDAYADSVRKTTEQEILTLRYNTPEQTRYRAQIAAYLEDDVVFPPRRQLFDHITVDPVGEWLWVLASGTGKAYARTWDVYSIETGTLSKRVSVPHKGAIVSAVVRDGVLYAVERPLAGPSRIAKYVAP